LAVFLVVAVLSYLYAGVRAPWHRRLRHDEASYDQRNRYGFHFGNPHVEISIDVKKDEEASRIGKAKLEKSEKNILARAAAGTEIP